MKEVEYKLDVIKYFQTNIFEALSAYNAWKMIYFSKSKGVVPEDMAEKYVEIQKYHPVFFILIEKAFLINFVIILLHAFDKNNDSFSLFKINSRKTEKFILDNIQTITSLKKLRDKLFAHKDKNIDMSSLKVPSIESLDIFFENLITFYNKIHNKITKSVTIFTKTEDVKKDIEELFKNIYRGEQIRKNEINIKWSWEENDKKISNMI
jgi:hypothetical protein